MRAYAYVLIFSLTILIGSVSAGQSEDPLGLSLKPKSGPAFNFSEIETTVLTFKNTSERALLIMSARLVSHGGELPLQLTNGVYGGLFRLDGDQGYELNSMIQQQTSEQLSSGFLLPGQVLAIDADFRFLGKSENFVVDYIIADKKYDKSAVSLAPLEVFIRATGAGHFISRYLPYKDEAWQANCMKERVGLPGPDSPQCAVLVPGVNELKQKSLTLSPAIPIEGVSFGLEQAIAKAESISGTKPEPEKVGYSEVLGGYVVFDQNGAWLLTSKDQKNKGSKLPRAPLALFWDIDSGMSVRIRVGEKQEPESDEPKMFWGSYNIGYGDGMYTSGSFIEIDAQNLDTFLEQVRKHNATLLKVNYFFDSRYYELILPN